MTTTAQLPFSIVQFSFFFLALPIRIDSIDKHSPGGPADGASSHVISFSSADSPLSRCAMAFFTFLSCR